MEVEPVGSRGRKDRPAVRNRIRDLIRGLTPPAPFVGGRRRLAPAGGAGGRQPARTLADKRTALWYVFEFLQANVSIGDMPADFSRRWVEWLRSTPQAPRKPWSMPRALTPESVRRFLLYPPARRSSDRPRSEQRIGHYWHSVRGFLAGLGLDTRLPRKQHRARLGRRDYSPRMALPPPLVASRREVLGWWAATLDPAHGVATRSERRRVVWMQALLLLTGMRLGECLAALHGHQEGRYLLLDPRSVKTDRPRILYVSRQALGLAKALRDYNPRLLWPRDDERFAGWYCSANCWHGLVGDCRPRGPRPDSSADPLTQSGGPARTQEKRNQAMRQVLSTWLRAGRGRRGGAARARPRRGAGALRGQALAGVAAAAGRTETFAAAHDRGGRLLLAAADPGRSGVAAAAVGRVSPAGGGMKNMPRVLGLGPWVLASKSEGLMRVKI